MISNYYTFRHIVSTLGSTLPGMRIREVYTQNPDELVIAFEEQDPRLVILCRADLSVLYLSDRASRARRNSVDLLNACPGRCVKTVAIDPGDRIVRIGLDGAGTIAAALYGPRSNVLLLDEAGVVQDAFKRPRALAGSPFGEPAPEQPLDFSRFRRECALAGTKTLSSVLRRSFPVLGGTLCAEVIARAGCDAGRPAPETDARSHAAIEEIIGALIAEIRTPAPRLYLADDGRPEYLSLVDLRIARTLKEELIPDIHAAVRRYLAAAGAGDRHEHDTATILTPLRAQIEKSRRALRATEADAADADRALEYEKFGNALLGALPALRKGERTFETAIAGEPVSIPLEPSLSPLQNAQKYFARAKRARAAGEESSRRRDELRSRIARAERLLEEAERELDSGGAEQFRKAHAEDLKEFGLGLRQRDGDAPPFRVFTVDGGFEVWAGKNGSNNDLLTLRYAKPDDLWFHARGGSGSHVVLRTRSGKGEPGKHACEQAAAIAAYYSKMKTAGTVAVAMTEKRFVRKPRGAPAGTVVIEREKVLFVTPALPRGAAQQIR